MAQKRSNLLLWIILGGGALFFLVLCLLALAVLFTDGASPASPFPPTSWPPSS